MATDVLRVLIFATLASSVAVLLVLLLRRVICIHFGAHAAYALWALVPLSASVALLPAPVAPMVVQIAPAATSLAAARLAVALPVANDLDPSPWLAGAWFLGAIVAFGIFAGQQRRFVRGLGQLSVAGDDTLRAQSTAGGAVLLGAWRPRVVVPADFEQRYSAAECALILAHEHTHRARGDAQVNALAAALRCLFWFNPLVHVAASRFRFDQELACDAIVISRFPRARRRYADAMLKTQLADFGLPVGCHWQASHPLKARIALLKQPLPSRARATLGVAVAAVLIVVGTYAAWAAQPPVPRTSAETPTIAASSSGSPNVVAAPAKVIGARLDPIRAWMPMSQSRTTGTSSSPARDPDPVKNTVGTLDRSKSASPRPANAFRAADTVQPPVFAQRSAAEGDGRPSAVAPTPGVAQAGGGNSAHAENSTTGTSGSPQPFIPPRVTRRWRPAYPADAYSAHREGESQVLVTIGADGSLKDARIDASSGSDSLDQAALEAVKLYTFSAAQKGGKPIDAQADVILEWSISPPLVMTIASGMTRKAQL